MIQQFDNDPSLGQLYKGPCARKKKKPQGQEGDASPKLKESSDPPDTSTWAQNMGDYYDRITPGQSNPVSYACDRQGNAFPSFTDDEAPFTTHNGVDIDPFEPTNDIRKTAYKAPPPEKDWTVLVYMPGDNDLEPYLVSNLVAMEKAGSSKKINIVAELDRGEAPRSPVSKWKGSRRFLVKQSDDPKRVNSPVAQDLGPVNMADPAHLSDFVKWGMKNYPARHYMLIINDHGYGFMGAGEDRGAKHTMNLPELSSALKDVVQSTGKKLDILGFDACLMGQTEVAYELKDYAKIMVASEETIGSSGWPYGDFKDAEALNEKGGDMVLKGGATVTADPADAKYQNYIQSTNLGISGFIDKAEKIISKQGELTPEIFAHGIVSQCEKHTDATPTMAAIRLGEYMDIVVDKMKVLTRAIMDTVQKHEVLEEIKKTQGFNLVATEQHPYGDYRDAYDFCDNIVNSKDICDENLKKAAVDVRKALNDAIMDSVEGKALPEKYKNSNGLSLYMPDTLGETDFGYRQTKFDKDTGWLDAMRMVASHDPDVHWDPLYEPPQLKSRRDEPQGAA